MQALTGEAELTARHRSSADLLAVDDEPANVKLLERVLALDGYTRVETATDPRAALARFQAQPPDLLLLDLHMPFLDGFEVLDAIAPWVLGPPRVPVLVLTADLSQATKRRALAAGARDFLLKPFDVVEVRLRIANLVETSLLHQALRSHAELLESRVRQRTRDLEQARLEVLHRLGRAAEFRDDQTHRHTERVGEVAARLAQALGWPSAQSEFLGLAAPLHDLGKIGVPDAVLLKPGPLTDEERELMRRHTLIGAGILAESRTPVLETAEAVAQHHHERWDGTGYPHGLAGPAIPAPARVVAVADVYDVLTHARPYKHAWSREEAEAEMRAQRGRQFDPDVVDALLGLLARG